VSSEGTQVSRSSEAVRRRQALTSTNSFSVPCDGAACDTPEAGLRGQRGVSSKGAGALVASGAFYLLALQSSILSITLFSGLCLRTGSAHPAAGRHDARGSQASAQSGDALKPAPAECIGLDKQLASADGKNIILCTLAATHI
jgi:hypothetical protein